MLVVCILLLLWPSSVQGGGAAIAAIKHHHRAAERRRNHRKEEQNAMKQQEYWDQVPLQCESLSRDFVVGSADACKSACEKDDDCEVFQWYDDETCWRGASLDCSGTDAHVLQGYRVRLYAWRNIGSQCRGLWHDRSADGDLETCQNNCVSDGNCNVYQMYTNQQCWRGSPSECSSLHDVQVEYDGQKAFKYIWKPLMSECTELELFTTGQDASACQSLCEADESCHVWQYFENEECWKAGYQWYGECYSGSENHGPVLNGGYKWYVTNEEGMSTCPKIRPYAYRPKHNYDWCCASNEDTNGRKWSDGGDRESCRDHRNTKCQAANGCTDYSMACPPQFPYAYRPDHGYDYCCMSDSDRNGTPWARDGDTESCYRDQYTPCPSGSDCADHGVCADDQCCNKKGDAYCSAYKDSCASDATVREQCAKTCNAGPCGPPQCTDCICTTWDGSNYADCTRSTTTNPCDHGFCVKCQKDGTTPMPGAVENMSAACDAYENQAPACTDCQCAVFDGSNYSNCNLITASRPCEAGYCVKCAADGVTPISNSRCSALEGRRRLLLLQA